MALAAPALALGWWAHLTAWSNSQAPLANLDWQPQTWTQPWRLVSAAWVHWSGEHLRPNLAGALALGLLGMAAQAPRRLAALWLIAWPLTQALAAALALLAPSLPPFAHEAGASGVLHAGVVLLALHLAAMHRDVRRWVGAALLVAVVAKLGVEVHQALGDRDPLAARAWQVNVRAHLGGFMAALVAWVAAQCLARHADRTVTPSSSPPASPPQPAP